MENRKLRFVLVGCGYIGKRHIEVLLHHPECELAALVDSNKDVLAQLSHLNLPAFEVLADCFSKVNADVVVIATPNGTHAPLAIEALQYQKHVLIEKPMALNRADAEAIIKKANDVRKQVMVVLQNRFSPVSRWLKETIDSKLLGAVFFVQVNCFWNRDERYYRKGGWHGTSDLDGGTLFTQFSHFIDSLYWLFGNINNISSRFYNFNHQHLTAFEDTGIVHFEIAGGGAGCFNFSTAARDKNVESSLTLLAENASIKVSGQYMDRLEFFHVGEPSISLPHVSDAGSTNNHVEMINAMVSAVKDNAGTNALDALYVVDIIERMYASGYQKMNS